jgi:thiol-disulfide isomerase/thioredoxin
MSGATVPDVSASSSSSSSSELGRTVSELSTHLSVGAPDVVVTPRADAPQSTKPESVQQTDPTANAVRLDRTLFEEVCAELSVTDAERQALLHPAAVTAFYFSASWCKPCKAFTPVLSTCYELAREEDGVRIEIIYVSGDANEEAFEAYREKMPWKRFALGPESELQAKLRQAFGLDTGFPRLVVTHPATERVLAVDGRRELLQDKDKAMPGWALKAALL